MLSEINQSPRGQILCDSTFMRSPEESHWVGARGSGRETNELLFHGDSFSLRL